jgi:prepilin-type N-terminal cleavage/methylation domain-containing protein
MMKLLKLRVIDRGHPGFTLIELIVGIALIGIIGGAAGTLIVQTARLNNLSNNRQAAITQVQNAVDSISRDALQAEGITWDGPASTLSLPIPISVVNGSVSAWQTPAVAYIYSSLTNTIQRTGAATSTIATNISDFSLVNQSGSSSTFSVTATVKGTTETRVFLIMSRSAP